MAPVRPLPGLPGQGRLRTDRRQPPAMEAFASMPVMTLNPVPDRARGASRRLPPAIRPAIRPAIWPAFASAFTPALLPLVLSVTLGLPSAWAQSLAADAAPLAGPATSGQLLPGQAAPANPAASSAMSPAPRLLTLDQALNQALSRHPALSAAAHEVAATQALSRQASARPNPELSASVERTAQGRSVTVGVGLPLELSGQRAARMAVARQDERLAAAQQAQERARVLAEVRAAYQDGVMAQAREALADAGREMAARALEAARKRVLAGKSSPLDETRARVDLAQAALAVKEAQADARAARLKLATLMGEDGAPSFGRLQEVWTPTERPALPELAMRLEGSPWMAVEAALVARHEVLAATEAERQRPAWTVSLGRKQEGGSSQPVLGLSVPLLILDRQEGAREAATQRLSQARERLRETRLRLLASLQEARARLDSAQASLAALKDEVLPAAEQALGAASQGFEAGKCSFLEVLEARRALLDARQRLLDSQAAALTAAHDIDRITGETSSPISGPITGSITGPITGDTATR